MDVERIVRTHVAASDAATAPAELVAGIEAGQIGLLEAVRASGEYITAVEDNVRLKGLTLLTNVIKAAPKAKINRQATQVLTGFYCDKLEDDPVLPVALDALAVLADLPTFGDGDCLKVYRSVVETVRMRSHVQSTRYLVFKLVDVMLSKHRDAFKQMGDDFIVSSVKLAEGEKDPRNLLLAFSIDHVILVEFDIYKHLEDLFDVVFCYFPITFRPPPDDPYGITTDDLKIALRRCMAATERFAPLGMPIFLEKLPPSLGPTKRDVLQSITACLPVYGSKLVLGFATDLWEALKTEIFYSSDKDIESDSLETLQTLLAVLYPTMDDKATGLAQSVLEECSDVLKEPEKSKAQAATKTLVACIRGSPSVGAFALSQILPQMFRQYHTESEVPHRGPILAVISSLLLGLRDVAQKSEERAQAATLSLARYRDELLMLVSAGVEHLSPTVQKPALDSLINLIHIPALITGDEIGYLVQKVNGLLISGATEELREDAVRGLGEIALLSPNSVIDICLPRLFGTLPDSAPSVDAYQAREQYRHVLDSLSTLCVQPGLFETLVIRVMTKVDQLCEASNSNPSTSEEATLQRECTVLYIHALLSALLVCLWQKVQAQHKDVAKYFDQVVPRLFSLFVLAARAESSAVAADIRLIGVAASIVEVMTQTLSAARQTAFAKILFTAFTTGRMTDLASTGRQTQPDLFVEPFKANASLRAQNLVILFAAGVVAMRPEIETGLSDDNQFCIDLSQWRNTAAASAPQRLAAAHALTSLVNKRIGTLETFQQYVETQVWHDVATGDTTSRARALELWVWISRALLARGHPSGLSMLAQVFELFDAEQSVAMSAATKLTILADKSGDSILSKANHAVVKALARQKMFNTIMPLIVKGCESGRSKHGYLTAFGSIVRIIPRSIVISDLQSLLPLILQALDLPDAGMRFNLIEALTSILELADSSSDMPLHDHAKTLVARLLRLATTTAEQSVDQRCRLAALRCLAAFPDVIRWETLQPLKPVVLRDLGKALDDPKRSVRKQAVETRAGWYRYGKAT